MTMSSPQPAASSSRPGSVADDGTDEEMDWEEILPRPAETVPSVHDIPNYNLEAAEQAGPSDGQARTGHIEITLHKVPKTDPKRKRQAEQNAELRALRLTCHKIHTVALLANAIIRNRWINDPLLHARLLSLTPMSLQTSFAMITKKRHPDAAKRGRLFESAMMRLTQWWYEEFFEIENSGHIRSRTFDEVQKILFEVDFDDDGGEVIRSPKSLMKHALKRRGSRDVSSQLFTALCRALGIPSRLVVSLQSVPWQASTGKQKPSNKKIAKGKEKADVSSDSGSQESDPDEEGDDMEEVSIPAFSNGEEHGDSILSGQGQTLSGTSTTKAKGKEGATPKPVVKLRKSKSSGQRLRARSVSGQDAPPIGGSPPVFWTEVFSRPDGKWMPVDPTRYIVNKRKVFEPSPQDRNNRMVYVVAVEEDGYCRDVTARYARDYGTKTSKAQLGGKGRKEWWESVTALVIRPYRLVRDDVEDEEFEYLKYTEGMPTSVAGFKNHPLYVLDQHLKREEVIFPKTEIGKFRGEPVYPRENVITLKTAENWMRMGRHVKEGAQALKWVKQRAVTIHRRRAMELAQQEGDQMLQGLYSEDQTESHIPDPVVDGIVPKNEFGNIDLYTLSMLPKGGAHIPYKGAAKVARRVGFDFAEAVTGFEFRKGHAFPIVSGIVVAAENEETLLEAYWEAEREAEEKEQAKRRGRVIKRWSRLIQGLRVRQRLQEQYKSSGEASSSILRHDAEKIASEIEEPGGFLTEADRIVLPFHLPRFEHNAYQPPLQVRTGPERDEVYEQITSIQDTEPSADFHPLSNSHSVSNLTEEDEDLEEVLPTPNEQIINLGEGQAPKSMLILAKEIEAQRREASATELNDEDVQVPVETRGKDKHVTSVQTDKRVVHPPVNLISHPPEVEERQEKPRTETKSIRRRTSTRKRSGTVSSISSPEILDNDADFYSEGDNWDETGLRQRSCPSSSVSKRKRSKQVSVAPSSSTRVLRTRIPKSVAQIKAEQEAEAAFREAIAE